MPFIRDSAPLGRILCNARLIFPRISGLLCPDKVYNEDFHFADEQNLYGAHENCHTHKITLCGEYMAVISLSTNPAYPPTLHNFR